MAHWKALSTATVAGLGVLAMAGTASAQTPYGAAPAAWEPNTGSRSENIDFADIDHDGDWDCAIGDGGDQAQDQNRIYINQGGLQGGTKGDYNDDPTRMPSVLDQTRDIEFVDYDNDGDADIYVSNTAQLVAQGNRWHTNVGGKQGGTLGFYIDETALRWTGLGGPGSSIAPSQVLPGNTFIDWSCDCDFGDLDNDGDLDLVHSSYGGAFGGQVPTRLFLNDGDGIFEEFNPSGFQLPIATISNGNPGLWAQGTQQANTSNSNGSFCDIASTALDIDLGDIDCDFDLDILHGAREEAPRMFINLFEESSLAAGAPTGTPLFRDVTTAVFPGGWSSGNGHYEQEMGDLDGDGDLDIYGLNWQVNFGFIFNDITLRNNGDGTFGNTTVLGGSSADDNEGDFVDYDGDGDLDLYVANFSGGDKLYRNNNNGGANFSFSQVGVGSVVNNTSLDADAADTDGDGDYDIWVSTDFNATNQYLINNVNNPDTHGPYLPKTENVGDFTASNVDLPARVHVYDNAPYYITWYNPTELQVLVDGIQLPSIDAWSAAGQMFRGMVPGNLVGAVQYRFVSEDEHGNGGSGAIQSLNASSGLPFASEYGTGTSGVGGGEPEVRALSVPFAGDTLYLSVSSNAAAGTSAIIGIGTASVPTTSIGLLTLNIGGTPLLIADGTLDANGDFVIAGDIPGTTSPGVSLFVQGWVLDPTGSGEILASSKGLEVVTQ